MINRFYLTVGNICEEGHIALGFRVFFQQWNMEKILFSIKVNQVQNKNRMCSGQVKKVK